jgi:hypothetical protein
MKITGGRQLNQMMMKTEEFKVHYVPSNLAPNTEAYLEGHIYVLFLEGSLAGAGFNCPCGCGLPLWIPNIPNHEPGSQEPRLVLRNSDDTLSITPSILVSGGCKSHFYISKNKVIA